MNRLRLIAYRLATLLVVVFAGCHVSLPRSSAPDHLTPAESLMADAHASVAKARGTNTTTTSLIEEGLTRLRGPEPTSASEPLTAARDSSVATDGALAVALGKTEALSTELTSVRKDIASLVAQVSGLQGQVSTLNGKLATETKGRQDAEARYHDAWLGGRAWRWITGLTIAFVGALIVGLVLNAKTDIFVAPLHVLAWLFKPSA
jgi:hypothetical protein